ncbi:MAG: hypothetical protein RMM28_09910 [Thermoleophilia bacterium]|nr:hypothetical protein [Gaiellaceae bacterium]MDW8339439.1 hypothetical protein [Thermoleophilia bacterium]
MRKLVFVGASIVLVALAAVGIALAAAGAPSGAGVQPTEVAMAPANACVGGQKLDGSADGGPTGDLDSGTHTFWFDGFVGSITITVRSTTAGKVFDFRTDDPSHLVTSMYVKGGPTANLYSYGMSGSSSDTGLHSPVNPRNGKYYGLSHICVFTDKK